MKPIKFKEQNFVIGENQKSYLPLPAWRDQTPEGQVISKWHFSFTERIRILFGADLWLRVLSFNKPLHPFHASIDHPFKKVKEKSDDRLSKDRK